MNERIKELIKKAGISTTEYYRNLDDTKMYYSKGIVSEWSDEFKQQLNLEPYLRVKAMRALYNRFRNFVFANFSSTIVFHPLGSLLFA